MAVEIISCPDCSRRLRVPDDLMGTLVKCPSCGETFTASPSGVPEPAPEQPPEQVPYQEPAWDRDASPPAAGESDAEPEGQGDNGYEEVEDRERPRRRRRRRRDDDYEMPSRKGSQPGKVQAIAIMTLVGGIFGVLMGLGLAASCYGLLWPGTYYSFVMGIMAIIKGSALLGQNARMESPPKTTAIMQIINIVNCDITNCVMGILILVFLNEPEVQRYYRG